MPTDQRKHRTIRKSKFAELCGEVGNIRSVEMFLEFLHNSGVVLYDRQLFGEQILLDQNWALEGVCSIVDRKKSYSHLKTLGGRFTRSILDLLVWGGYSESEQRLFLSLMESCNVCFRHGQSAYGKEDEPEYIAPDLLPTRIEVEAEIAARWTGAEKEYTAVFEYPFLRDALVRSVISRVGKLAGDSAVYWKFGVCLYGNKTSAHAIIDANYADDSRGEIEIRANGNRGNELVRRIVAIIKGEN